MVGLIFKLVVRDLLILSHLSMDKDMLYTNLRLDYGDECELAHSVRGFDLLSYHYPNMNILYIK